MQRRRFLANASGALAAAGAAAVVDAPYVIAQTKVQWRMSTSWPPILEAVREESEKTPMARKVHASFTKFKALVGPWDHVAEGAYHQLVAG